MTEDLTSWSVTDHLRHLLRALPIIVLLTIVTAGSAFFLARRFTGEAYAEAYLRVAAHHGFGPVERPADVALRLSSFSFTQSLVGAEPIRATLTAYATKGSNLVRITAVAPTIDEARSLVERAVERVISEHRVTSDRIQKLLVARLEDLRRQIAELEASLGSSGAVKDGPFAELSEKLRQQRAAERLAALRSQELELVLDVDPENPTTSMLVAGPATRFDRKDRRFGVMGAVAGLAFSLLVAYGRLLWRSSTWV